MGESAASTGPIEQLPEGLDSVSVQFKIPVPESTYSELQKAFLGSPRFQFRPDNRAFFGVLANSRSTGHAHIEGEYDTEEKSLALELEVLSGPHDSGGAGLDVTDVIERCLQRVPDLVSPSRAVIAGYFTFDLKTWEPTVPLPFSPPGVIEKMPGVPKISGLDFSFGDTTETQPMSRAFVTTYEGVGRISVRLLLISKLRLDLSLPGEAVRLMSSQLGMFVRKKQEPSSAKK